MHTQEFCPDPTLKSLLNLNLPFVICQFELIQVFFDLLYSVDLLLYCIFNFTNLLDKRKIKRFLTQDICKYIMAKNDAILKEISLNLKKKSNNTKYIFLYNINNTYHNT